MLQPCFDGHGTFAYIFHKNQPNVTKYTIHGSYGNWGPQIRKKILSNVPQSFVRTSLFHQVLNGSSLSFFLISQLKKNSSRATSLEGTKNNGHPKIISNFLSHYSYCNFFSLILVGFDIRVFFISQFFYWENPDGLRHFQKRCDPRQEAVEHHSFG